MRQERLVAEARDQIASIRIDQSSRLNELLSVQQKLTESELSKQFLGKDRDHLAELLN